MCTGQGALYIRDGEVLLYLKLLIGTLHSRPCTVALLCNDIRCHAVQCGKLHSNAHPNSIVVLLGYVEYNCFLCALAVTGVIQYGKLQVTMHGPIARYIFLHRKKKTHMTSVLWYEQDTKKTFILFVHICRNLHLRDVDKYKCLHMV